MGFESSLPRPRSQDFQLCLALDFSQNVPWSMFYSLIHCIKNKTYNYFVYIKILFSNTIWESLLLFIGPLVKNL